MLVPGFPALGVLPLTAVLISVIGKMSLSVKQPLLGRSQTLLKRMHLG